MNKQTLFVTLILGMALSISACGSSPATATAPGVSTTAGPANTSTASPTPQPSNTPLRTATPQTGQPAFSAAWSRLATNSPTALRGMQVVYDSARQVFVLFGGTDDSNKFLNETWEFDGKSWKKISTATIPPTRLWHGMVFDSARKVVVMFGGMKNDGGTILNDTWEYDGKDWTQIKPARSPSPRYGFAAVFDSCRNRTVIFGGDNHSDIWEYDGKAWMQVKTSSTPPTRGLNAMTFDPNKCKTVLFGGGNSGKGLNDTWEYDGSNWKQVTTANTPPGRWGHAIAYDAKTGHVILFGGYNADRNTTLNDTWYYAGENWRKLTLSASPAASEQSAMVYDPIASRMLLFGGYGADGAWALTTGAVESTATRTPAPQACGMGWSRLLVGKRAILLPGDPNLLRSEPRKGDNLTGKLYPGTVVSILEGPICADGLVFWKVETATLTGWTAEGDGKEYWLEPVK